MHYKQIQNDRGLCLSALTINIFRRLRDFLLDQGDF